MCNPVLIGMAVMSVAAMYQSVQATNAANKQAEAEGEAANRAASYDYQRLADQKTEVDEQASQDKFQRQLQTAREHGRIAVAMGEAGVGGNSAMRVMNNAIMQGSYDTSVIEANRASKARQISTSVGGVQARAEGRINIAESKSVSRGSGMMNMGIAGISGAAQGYSMGSSFGGKTMTTKPPGGTVYT